MSSFYPSSPFRYQPRPRPKYPPQFPDRRRPSSSNPYSPIKRPNSNANGVRVKLINKRPKRPPSSAAGGIKDLGANGGDASGTDELKSVYNATTTVKTDLLSDDQLAIVKIESSEESKEEEDANAHSSDHENK